MTALEWFLLGGMVFWTPALIYLALLLRRAPTRDDQP
jgi:hypothetical protein